MRIDEFLEEANDFYSGFEQKERKRTSCDIVLYRRWECCGHHTRLLHQLERLTASAPKYFKADEGVDLLARLWWKKFLILFDSQLNRRQRKIVKKILNRYPI